MLLRELGDRTHSVQVIRNDDRVFDAESVIGDRKIEFSAVYYNNYWNVVFSEVRYNEEDDEWVGSVEATGSGNEFQVLSMITTCLQMLLKKNPQAIKFSAAKGDSRAGVYRRIGNKLLRGFDKEEEDTGKEIEFRYTKPTKDIEL